MKLLSTLLLACTCMWAAAQEFPYTLNYLEEPYVSFDDGTDAMPFVWETAFAQIPLEFEFDYFGNPVPVFNLTGVGAMLSWMDAGVTTQSIFLPYSSGLVDAGAATGDGHTSIVSYKTTGVEPERVFHMQWDNCAFKSEFLADGTVENRVSFQVRLYEATGDIAVHFGPSVFNGNGQLHDGNAGPSLGFYANLDFSTTQFENYWIVGGPVNDPQPLWGDPEEENDNSYNPLEGNPEDGTLYYFSTSPLNIASAAQPEVQVFPNPAHDRLNIQVSDAHMGASYEVVNLAGQVIQTGQFTALAHTHDVSTLESGVYFLRCLSGTSPFAHRFVKQ